MNTVMPQTPIQELTQRVNSVLARVSAQRLSRDASASIWGDLTRFGQALLALGSHGAGALASTPFSNLALASHEWKPQALCATIGLLSPKVAIQTYLKDTTDDHEPWRLNRKIPPSHPHSWLCSCAAMALTDDMKLSVPDLNWWIALVIDKRPLSRQLAQFAAQSQPYFDPGPALEQLFASRRFSEFIHQRQPIMEVFYACPGFLPEKLHPALLLWFNADGLLQSHGGDAIGSRVLQAAKGLPEPIKAQAFLNGIDLYPHFDAASEAMTAFGIAHASIAHAGAHYCEVFSARILDFPHPATKNAIGSISYFFPKAALFSFHACPAPAFLNLTPQRLSANAFCAISCGEWHHARDFIKHDPGIARSVNLLLAISFGLDWQNSRKQAQPTEVLHQSMPLISRCALSQKSPSNWIGTLSAMIPEFIHGPLLDLARPALASLASRLENRELRRHAQLPASSSSAQRRI